MSTKSLETLATVSARIRELSKRTDTEAVDERARLTEAVRDLATSLPRVTTRARATDFVFTDEDAAVNDDVTRQHGPVAGLRAMHETPARTDEQREVQTALDDLYLMSNILRGKDGRAVDVRGTRYFKRLRSQLPALRRLDFDSAAASDWIPEAFSAEMVRQIRLDLKVAALFPRIDMPTATYHVPIEGADAKAFYVPEVGETDADLDPTKRIPPTLESPALTNVTFVARKLASRVTCSSEVAEDTIVPLLPYLREKLARAMAVAQEDGCLNASTASPHPDADVTSGSDARKAFDGLRSRVVRGTFLNGSTIVTTSSAGRVEIGDIRALRLKLGKYGVTPGDCALVTGPLGFNRLLSLQDSNGNFLTATMDKLGPNATLVTGQVASLDGWPVVLSEHVREDLNHAAFYDGVTTDSTVILLVQKRSFTWGDRRLPTLRVKDVPETDSLLLTTTQRLDFQSWYPTLPTVGYIRDVR